MGYIKINGQKITNPVSRVLIMAAFGLIFAFVAAAILSAVVIKIGIALAAALIAAPAILVVGPAVAGLFWLSNQIEKSSRSKSKRRSEIVQDCRSAG